MLEKIFKLLYWLDNQIWFWTIIGLINIVALYAQISTNQTVGRILITFGFVVFCVFQVNRTARREK